ncbi:helix-turn-helix domain-containing protein [Nonomuraea sp. NPDC005983]|uniref:winged helix-turn-helix transcriptional regulator n=1 Tax=Nonomuraea sp. NPDC005983 TaxID=3155595 RepID=UPI0033BF7B04
MAALDLFGRRWSLQIVWELHDGPSGFRSLQQRCDGMSSSVLRQRLLELAEAGLIRQADDRRYALTSLGEDAYQALRPLVQWSQRWADTLTDHDPGE